jgi:hypothetical protein
MKGLNSSFDSITVASVNRSSTATLTFAMRHRCLRVASILVPQEALEEVLREEEFSTSASHYYLKTCSFGSFCAKELEEMSLPIPHSDLLQLSQMHFPSYARALWRHHRDIKGGKGRLLLLILELYLKESISDYTFFMSIIKEIEALRLPRTLLLGFECIVRYMERIGPEAVPSFFEATNEELSRIVAKLSQIMFADIQRTLCALADTETHSNSNNKDEDQISIITTMNRLGRIVLALSGTSSGQKVLLEFSHGIIERVLVVGFFEKEQKGVYGMLEQVINGVETNESRLELISRLSTLGQVDTTPVFANSGVSDNDQLLSSLLHF